MEIIKPGNLEEFRRRKSYPKIFDCRACGCRWEANNQEYKQVHINGEGWFAYMKCPTCKTESDYFFIKH